MHAGSNIRWVIIFALFCLGCAAVWIMRLNADQETGMARIMQDGKVIRTIDLAEVREPYEFTIEYEGGGSNVVRVEKGRIAVTEADCPDKICVKRGFTDNSAVPIVCLPHKLVISVTDNDTGRDAVAGIN